MILLESSLHAVQENNLSGIAISKDAVVRSNAGFEKFLKDSGDPEQFCAGKYAASYWISNSKKVIRTDSEGQELIFYYFDGNFWAYSNSFYVLCWYLKKVKVKLKADKAALSQILVSGMAFDQPVSERLPIFGIQLLKPGEQVDIDEGQFRIQEAVRRNAVVDGHGFSARTSYFCNFYQSLFRQFVDCGMPVNLELSGGLDSRVLAALLHDLSGKDNFGYISQKSKPEDYLIAEHIVEGLGGAARACILGRLRTQDSYPSEAPSVRGW